MRQLSVTFDHVPDTTGYLFSLAKSAAAAVYASPWKDYGEDIIGASGFAFRMWADSKELCPSAASIWEFRKQKDWFENSGLTCDYIERLWGEDVAEEERRLQAAEMIRASIDRGAAAAAWDISGCEWGLITGYDDTAGIFFTLSIDGTKGELPYEKLGRLDVPILSVITFTGACEKSADQILADTKKLALSHLKGEEWCDNAKGLAVYDTMIQFIREKLSEDTAWNLEYYLGTYGALKWYAWKFFEKYQEPELASLYHRVYEAWKAAFDIKCTQDAGKQEVKEQIIEHLLAAQKGEQDGMSLLSKGVN